MPETARNSIDLWVVENIGINDEDLLDHYLGLLDTAEQTRYERLLFPLHRQQFLVTRALVRTVLSDYLQIDKPASLEFTSNRHGKPGLSLETTLQFNLTHTNGLIVLAVMEEDAVGIDVEYLSRQADIMKLAARYFSQDETEMLKALPVSEWNTRFFDLWTLKEAYLKACGTGLRTPLHAFSFTLENDAVSVSFSPELDDNPALWQFWQLDWKAAWRISLAVNNTSGEDYQIRLRNGIPMQGFTEVAPVILRRSIR